MTKQKKIQGAFFFSVCLLISASFFYKSSSRVNTINIIEDGLRVCFSRVSQLYTARVLKDYSSEYLTRDFKRQTQNCFSEVLSMSEAFLGKFALTIDEKLNQFSGKIYKFQNKVYQNKSSVSNEGVFLSQINRYFQGIESDLKKIEKKMNSLKMNIESKLFWWRYAFISSLLCLMSQLIWLFISGLRLERKNLKIEKKALAVLSGDEIESSDGILLMVQELLKINNFYYLKEIFDESVLKAKDRIKNSEIEKIWRDSEENQEGISVDSDLEFNTKKTSVNVRQIILSNLDFFISSFFENGTEINLEMDKPLKVYADDKEAPQFFYHIFKFLTCFKDKKITISWEKREQNIDVKVLIENCLFPKELLLFSSVESNFSMKMYSDIYMAKKVGKDWSWISLKNRSTSAELKLSFKLASEKKLVRFVKTTRRNFLNR